MDAVFAFRPFFFLFCSSVAFVSIGMYGALVFRWVPSSWLSDWLIDWDDGPRRDACHYDTLYREKTCTKGFQEYIYFRTTYNQGEDIRAEAFDQQSLCCCQIQPEINSTRTGRPRTWWLLCSGRKRWVAVFVPTQVSRFMYRLYACVGASFYFLNSAWPHYIQRKQLNILYMCRQC